MVEDRCVGGSQLHLIGRVCPTLFQRLGLTPIYYFIVSTRYFYLIADSVEKPSYPPRFVLITALSCGCNSIDTLVERLPWQELTLTVQHTLSILIDMLFARTISSTFLYLPLIAKQDLDWRYEQAYWASRCSYLDSAITKPSNPLMWVKDATITILSVPMLL